MLQQLATALTHIFNKCNNVVLPSTVALSNYIHNGVHSQSFYRLKKHHIQYMAWYMAIALHSK